MSAERASQLASAIKAAGIKAGGRVGIYAPNVPNWMLVIQACNRSSLQVGELHYGRRLHAFVDNCLPMPMLEQNPISSPCAHQANCLLVSLCALQASISMSLQCLALTHLMCHLRMLRSRCWCAALTSVSMPQFASQSLTLLCLSVFPLTPFTHSPGVAGCSAIV